MGTEKRKLQAIAGSYDPASSTFSKEEERMGLNLSNHVSPVPPLYLWRFRYLRFMSTSDPSLRPLLQSWHSKGQSSHIGLAGIRVRCFSCSCPIGLTGNAGTAVTPVARLSPYHLAWHARLAFRSISYMPCCRLLGLCFSSVGLELIL